MKAIKLVAISLLILMVLFFGVGFFLPTTWNTDASTVIAAKPEVIFPHLNTLREWPRWTAWNEESDPTVQWTFTGPESGVGCTMSWTGEELGTGSLIIKESVKDQKIAYELSMEEFPSASGTLELLPGTAGTIVQWRGNGDIGMAPLGGYFIMFMKPAMKAALSDGLERLKQQCEGGD